MRTLQQSVTRKELRGEPLPVRFPTLEKAGIVFRRGQTAVIAGQPGSGKSLLALDMVAHLGQPAMYFSADSDEVTVTSRCAAMLTGLSVTVVEHQLNHGEDAQLASTLESLSHVRFCYDTAPSLHDIEMELKAYIEIYGDTPNIIVFDNLMNIQPEHADEWRGLKEIMENLRQLARITNACVIVLHHTSESEGDPSRPQPRKAVIGKVNQAPELILTVAHDPNTGDYRIAPVKNRSGKADPSGTNFHSLMVDLPTMSLYDYTTQEFQCLPKQ